MTSGIRVNELKLAGAQSGSRTYGVSFRTGPGESFRPLSVIAGPASTGKTTVVDFIRYCLGDDEHPQHPEVVAAVRAALLEAELDGNPTVVERATPGAASKFASVWAARMGNTASTAERRISTEPPSNPDGLSQFVLAACDLNGIELPEAPTKEDSRTVLLSIRDMFRVIFVPNERLDNRNLVFEQSHHMVRQKFLQSIDVMFGVHDNRTAVLAQRHAAAQQAARAAAQTADMLRQVADDDYPRGPLQLALDASVADAEVATLTTQIRELDIQQRSSETTSSDLRNSFAGAQRRAADARVRLRDRRSLLQRLNALRAQYADDKRKLNFLKDAERFFDPLKVMVCPSCMSQLAEGPRIVDGHCSMCNSMVVPPADDAEAVAGNGQVGHASIASELSALTRRMTSLDEYVERLQTHTQVLERESLEADEQADESALALDNIVTSPAPWLALRDDLGRRLTEMRLAAQAARAGVNAWTRVADADANRERLVAEAQRIGRERRASRSSVTRAAVVGDLSTRFAAILAEIGYPKLENPYLDQNLVPHVRNLPYTAASSGGMVLIGLAWNLALWEVAFELDADAPGLLVIDSPQKNLGHNSKASDVDFADATLVENFYAHAKGWLAAEGSGAQLIVVDNSPPEIVADDVVVRFTRDADVEPYGLITDATN